MPTMYSQNSFKRCIFFPPASSSKRDIHIYGIKHYPSFIFERVLFALASEPAVPGHWLHLAVSPQMWGSPGVSWSGVCSSCVVVVVVVGLSSGYPSASWQLLQAHTRRVLVSNPSPEIVALCFRLWVVPVLWSLCLPRVGGDSALPCWASLP